METQFTTRVIIILPVVLCPRLIESHDRAINSVKNLTVTLKKIYKPHYTKNKIFMIKYTCTSSLSRPMMRVGPGSS